MSLQRKIKRNFKKNGYPKLHPSSFLQYYSLVFKELMNEIADEGYKFKSIHPIRYDFWNKITNNSYSHQESSILLQEYYSTVETCISIIISRKSISYWLHILRRFSPLPMCQERDIRTTAITRAILEVAIQKYGMKTTCCHISLSNTITPEQILNGRLMAAHYKNLAQTICKTSQLVLTKFDKDEVKEFLDLNKLAFEIWKCGAGLRTTGKGGQIVKISEPEMYGIWMSDDLDKLIDIYDSRIETQDYDHSATGTVFREHIYSNIKIDKSILIARYNFEGIGLSKIEHLFRKYHCATYPNIPLNFIWTPFEIVSFYKSHKSWSQSFEPKYNLSLSSIFLIMIALYFIIHDIWKEAHSFTGIYRSHMRAYYGPTSKENIMWRLRDKIPVATFVLGISPINIDDELNKAFDFLSLTEEKIRQIDLLLYGPHSIFLPIDHDTYFIDFAWFPEILYDLFYKVELSDQNFKGNKLEQYIHNAHSPLPSSKLIAFDNSKKQIDATYDLGEDILAIIECKAIGRSLGYERGDDKAIQYRNQIIEKILREVDDKAKWLVKNPKGRNFDISQFRRVIPIGLTPFVEFIPSLDEKYWINGELPRVLTPQELAELLESGELLEHSKTSPNLVSL